MAAYLRKLLVGNHFWRIYPPIQLIYLRFLLFVPKIVTPSSPNIQGVGFQTALMKILGIFILFF